MKKNTITSIVIPLLIIVSIHNETHASEKSEQNLKSQYEKNIKFLQEENNGIIEENNRKLEAHKKTEENLLQTIYSQNETIKYKNKVIEQKKIEYKYYNSKAYASGLGIAMTGDWLLCQTLAPDSKFKPLHQAVKDSKKLQYASLFITVCNIPVPSYFHEKHTGIDKKYQACLTGLIGFAGETANALLLQYLKKQWYEKKIIHS